MFWGFLAFGGYTVVEFMSGLGLVDLTHASWFLRYRLLLTDLNPARLQERAQVLREDGCDVRQITCDITDPVAVGRLAAAVPRDPRRRSSR